MSINITLPKDWIDIKIENRIIFINLKENLVSYHPPMDLNNIGAFLNLYNINRNRSELINLLRKSTKFKDRVKSQQDENQKKSQLSNGLSMEIDSQINSDQNLQDSKTSKQEFDKKPIVDGKILNYRIISQNIN